MNILITGGAGFLGSNLAHRMVKKGCNVVLIDNFHPDYGANEFNLLGLGEHTRLVKEEITNQQVIDDLAAKVDVIFHLAAQCSHVDSMTNPWLDLEYNCRGTLAVLEAARKSPRMPAVIYAGTRAIIGQPLKLPATEMTLPNPTDIYGVNKFAGELYGSVYARVHGIPFVSLRLTNCYGKRHQMRNGKYGILNWLIGLAMQGKLIRVFGTGNQLRDYLYADDAIETFVLAASFAEQLREGRTKHAEVQIGGTHIPFAVFNIGSGIGIRFLDVVKKIVSHTKTEYELVPWPEDRKAIETGDYISDGSNTSQILSWKATTDFDSGLLATFEFYKEYGSYYGISPVKELRQEASPQDTLQV